jgi:hypothetical protein
MADIPGKIEDFLVEGNWVFKKRDEKTWTINDEFEGIENLVIFFDDPLIIFRLKLMEIPSVKKEEFFETLLRLNAESLVHGAYALEGNNVILVDTLECENLDLNEFQASIDAIYMALASDYNTLKEYQK